MSKDQSASRSDGELLEDVDYILAKLDQRVLTTDGGKADPMVHHWNLTEGDSAMHREAAAHIRALVEKLAAVRSERPRWIPLSERLPTEADSYGGDVLTLSGTGKIGAQHWKHVAAMVADAKLNNEECYYAFWHQMPALTSRYERPDS